MEKKELIELLNSLPDDIEITIWATCDNELDTEFESETIEGYMICKHCDGKTKLVLTTY